MSFGFALAVAGLGGFIALSYEILWYRVFSIAIGGTAQGFALLLGFYLYGIAAGGLAAARLSRARAAASGPRQVLALAGFCAAAYLTAHAVIPALAWGCQRDLCLAALPAVAVSTTLLGTTLPLISHLAIRPDWQSGVRLSAIYFANILGCSAGSLLTGYVLLDRLPASGVALLLVSLGLLLTAALLWTARGPVAAFALIAVTGLPLASTNQQLFDRLYEKLLFKHLFRPGITFKHTVENRVGVINVTEAGKVFGSGAYDGWARIDLVNDPNLLVRATAIPAFHPRPRRVLMIGLSMGAWAQLIANWPTVEHLTIVEINPGYLSLIPQYPDVASLLRNPKVQIDIDDGRRWLARHPDERFDLIVANITFHWREHATNLLSVEFLNLIRRHLERGGVYYYNTTFSADVMKTGFTVFPHGFRFGSFIAVSDAPTWLDRREWATTLRDWTVDGRPMLDPADTTQARRLQEVLALPDQDPLTGSLGVETREEVLARITSARVATDDNMAPEWRFVAIGAWDP